MAWAGDVRFGMGDTDMNVYQPSNWHINYWRGDLGRGALLEYLSDTSQGRPCGAYVFFYDLNTRYHNVMIYDANAKTLSWKVTRVSDGAVMVDCSPAYVGRFSGIDRLYGSSIGDNYAPGATGEGYIDNVVLYVLSEPILVDIDIKPGSYPNAINLGSYGLIPVAIFSGEDFDANTVDPNTVTLSGALVARRGKGGEKFMAHEEDVNADGLVDLVVQVVTGEIDAGLLEEVEEDGVTYIYAVLTGSTYDGQDIEGEDEIIIVPPE